MLALCDMSVLYLRNVPEATRMRLEILASREGLSVSAFAVRELSKLARRADNPALVGDLPDLGIAAESIVTDLDADRTAR